METTRVVVPGTTANLGPGFDCLGAALTLHNQFQFSLADELRIEVTGLEAERVPTDATNLAYQSFAKLYAHLGQVVPPVHLTIHLGVPAARGLGSSATAIVGGLMGANVLAGNPLSQKELMNLAIGIEGHPDNVVPALLGGCQLTASGTTATPWEVCPISWHPDIVPIVAIPDFALSTAEARKVLPASYSRADAIFNVAHLGLLLRGLETARVEWLKAALQDRIHQPYRESLIPGYGAVRSAAMEAGAMGLVISGAGPTLLALATPGKAPVVQTAIATAWKAEGIAVDVKVLAIDRQGARC
ncbi:MAG: homoserine kinase [Leptolyngbyaceae cyanobacterium bins.59]|nr:homoserine kinase [Leptolyngbyaceae cyanobacterium bins.59]